MSNKKDKKDERLTIEKEIQIVRDKLLEIDPNFTPELIHDIEGRLEQISKHNKSNHKMFDFMYYIIVFLVLCLGFLIVNVFQDRQYKSELEQRLDLKIKDYNKKDSLFDKYLGTDSTGSYTTYTVDGKLQTYKDLLKYTDHLEKNNSDIKMKLIESNIKYEKLKFNYDFIVETYGITVMSSKKGTSNYVSVNSKKLEECYGEKYSEAKQMVSKFNKQSDSLSKLKPSKVKENK